MQLKELSRKLDLLSSSSTITNANQPSRQHYPATTNSRQHEPQQPLFVGHTRSAFNLDVAKTSLSKMGISPDAIDPISGLPSLAPSPREPSPESDPHTNLTPDPLPAKDPLLTIALPEVCRLLAVFHEEIESLYPFVNSDTLVTVARTKTERLAMQMGFMGSDLSEDRDINILKIAVAIAVVVEAKGRNSLSSKLVDSTDKRAAQVTRSLDVDLRDLQWLTLLSIYYFQIDEDLLAWRTIGNAARMALEMGLHRRRSLTDNYKSADDQAKATRIFWCVYVLDRRWSFGTGLSFALNDRDIDPELPEPGDDYAHLRCMIGYGRLCTKVWDALPPYGSPTSTIPLDQVQYLEFLIRNWLDSIPAHLQFNHPRLGLASRNQPRILRRLCAFLYLRGNHLRTLVYRHHVLSPSFVHANLHSARLVVDIAKDSIQVLVDLAETSDIYARQQAAFNYFLLSALAVILLAVCNAPRTFSNSCYESFSSAVELVRKFSRGSLASRRLWNSIRGLLPAIRTLGLKIGSETTNTQYEGPSNVPRDTPDQNQEVPHPPPVDKSIPQVMPLMLPPEGTTTIPNTFQMGDDLMGLFNAFGQADAETIIFDDPLPSLDSNYMQMTFPMEISRRFQGLI
ncbi:putative fungal specific transcription factor domain-containing protein [Rosellinia necatrix]|uniref:Putative fungal specific transcription factor domain-containing protein n=1 Tax=Rosellinia necatrix TaxID=77044 RepID=A0A1S7UM55_ROSNE|nr:putative fungal specific transcription factor domain-containing protein [Rosellinia necatrix]